MSAMPDIATMAPDSVSDLVPSDAIVTVHRRSRRRSAEIVPFRQDEDILRSFFAHTVVPTPVYGLTRRMRATLVTLVAVTIGGGFVAAASQLFEI